MKALFVIDMVNGFVKEGAMHDIKIMSIVPCIENLVREFDGDCYFIRDAHDRDAVEFKSFPSHCVKGTSESEVIDELRPYVKKEILKNSTNAFHVIDPHLYDLSLIHIFSGRTTLSSTKTRHVAPPSITRRCKSMSLPNTTVDVLKSISVFRYSLLTRICT